MGGGGGEGKAEPGPVTITITATYSSSIPSFFLSFLCKGDPYPDICAVRTMGAGDFIYCGLHAGSAAGFFCLL
jgi:hypothetical protein